MEKKYTSAGTLICLSVILGWLSINHAFAQCDDANTLTVPSIYSTSALVGNGNFNAIIFGNHTAPTGDTEGRLAVGGNFGSDDSYSVGQAVVGLSAPMFTDNFIVNGTFNNAGTNWSVRGNFIYTTNAPGSTLPTHVSGVNTASVADSRLKFSMLKTYYTTLSSSLAALPTLGSSSVSGGNIINLTGDGTAHNYIFNVTLPNGIISGLNFSNIPAAGSTILINIQNVSVSITGGAISNTSYRTKTLFNFPNATSLDLTSFLLEASVLAPKANFSATGGGINGQAVIGGNVTQEEGFEFHSFCLAQTNPLTLTLSGNVFDDGNGLTDNIVNTSGIGALTPVNGTDIDPAAAGSQPVYATLVNSGGTAVATVSVTSGGTYSFTNVATDTYSIVLSTNSAGSLTASLPTSWTNVGEHVGITAGIDGPANGILTGITVASTNVTNANFGIDKKPVVNPATVAAQPNPGGTIAAPVSSTAFTGSDLEDGTYPTNLTGRVVTLTPATNGTLYYSGTAVTGTQTIPSFDPTKVTLDPTATGATTGSSGAFPDPTFIYSMKDNAGVLSDPKTVIVPFTAGVPDLVPILYALPSTQYGTTNFTVVVDIYDLNPTASTGLITVYMTKDPLVALSFNGSSVFVGGKLVQNSIWTFDSSDKDFYVFTTSEVIAGKGHKSFGLTGVLTPGNTKGTLTISTTILGGSGGEVKIDNNSDADKIDYFKK